MYFTDFIRDIVNQKLQRDCIGHQVTFEDEDEKEITIFCTYAEMQDDDGNVWIEFTDDKKHTYRVTGQGCDIWFEVKK